MANGDAAAAAGLEVFAGTQDRRLGYDNDNIRGDEIAALMARLVGLGTLYVQNTEPTTPAEGDVWISWT